MPRAASAFRLNRAELRPELGRALEAIIPPLTSIQKRTDFLAVRGGRRASAPPFLIETRQRADLTKGGSAARFGFTVTKKLGNAVKRNRIKRRLKAVVRQAAADLAQPGYDYVVVARLAAFDRPYSSMIADLERTLADLHRPREKAGSGAIAPKAATAPKKAAP